MPGLDHGTLFSKSNTSLLTAFINLSIVSSIYIYVFADPEKLVGPEEVSEVSLKKSGYFLRFCVEAGGWPP